MSSQNPFETEIERLEAEAESANPPLCTRLSDEQKWGVGLGVFFVGGLLGAVSNPTDPVFAFVVIGGVFATVAWATVTKSGVAFRRNLGNEMESSVQQQQQVGGGSEPTVVCGACGWQNPRSNNYCHDCGSELDETG